MNQVSALQHDPAGEPALTDYWAALSGRSADFETEELTAREEMLRTAFDRLSGGRGSREFLAIAASIAGNTGPGRHEPCHQRR